MARSVLARVDVQAAGGADAAEAAAPRVFSAKSLSATCPRLSAPVSRSSGQGVKHCGRRREADVGSDVVVSFDRMAISFGVSALRAIRWRAMERVQGQRDAKDGCGATGARRLIGGEPVAK